MTIYHFVGIKGSGMSPLAQVLFEMGYQVQGSDVEKHFFTQIPLEQKGIKILPFDEKNIQSGLTVIAGNAFKDDHPELVRAAELGLPIIRYHVFLGELLKKYTSIAVTGTHGKTTTTGILAHVLKGIRPTSYLIGDGTGYGDAESEYFAFESCEYRRHFLAYHPDYCVMTNIDFDHPDYYHDIEDVFDAFQQMSLQVKKGIIACGDDPFLRKIQAEVAVTYYGFGAENDFQAINVKSQHNGTSFDVIVNNKDLGHFIIPNFGDHSVLNALGVIAVCFLENLEMELVKELLSTFKGVKRRFSEKVHGNQILIDDYAHHQTEILATIDSARKKYPNRELVAVFQPHTYSRTSKFLNEFAEALSKADKVYLCEIFGSARETNSELTIEVLREKIQGAEVLSEWNTDKLKKHENGVLIFMGAGDVQKFQQAYEKI